jgi:hypothetical protein
LKRYARKEKEYAAKEPIKIVKTIVKELDKIELNRYLTKGTPVCEVARIRFLKLSKVILEAKILGG